MYGLFAYIDHPFKPNVGNYTIHLESGVGNISGNTSSRISCTTSNIGPEAVPAFVLIMKDWV